MKNNIFLLTILLITQSCQVKLGEQSILNKNPETEKIESNLPNSNRYIKPNNLGSINFRTILRGMRSNVKKYDFKVIKDEIMFKQVWDEHTGNETNPLYLPKIDFEEKQVIFIFLGERPTTGYDVEIEKIEALDDKFKINIREVKPLQGNIIKAEVTQPFVIIETLKTEKTVVFENSSPINSSFVELDFEMLESGSNSGIKTFTKEIAKNQEEFSELYQKHLSNQAVISSTIFPKVDFSNKMAAAIFLGERPSSGYNIEVKKVIKSNSLITIFAEENAPNNENNNLEINSNPFTFVTFPNSDLPVEFDVNLVFQSNINQNRASNKVFELEANNFLSGNESGINNSEFLLINSKQDFDSLWKRHTKDNETFSPDVNFNEKSLIALFLGKKESSTIKVDIDKIVKNNNDLRVFVKLSKNENETEINGDFEPFGFSTIPKHTGSVSFIINDLTN